MIVLFFQDSCHDYYEWTHSTCNQKLRLMSNTETRILMKLCELSVMWIIWMSSITTLFFWAVARKVMNPALLLILSQFWKKRFVNILAMKLYATTKMGNCTCAEDVNWTWPLLRWLITVFSVYPFSKWFSMYSTVSFIGKWFLVFGLWFILSNTSTLQSLRILYLQTF